MFFKKKPKVEAPVIHAGDADFDEVVLGGSGITVVDFWAGWCAPCRMMSPILDEIAIEFEHQGVRIVKVDTERAPETAERFEIRSIPTLVFFRDGEPLFEVTGVVSKPVLQREIAALVAGEGETG
jgi:thioredoxin 1